MTPVFFVWGQEEKGGVRMTDEEFRRLICRWVESGRLDRETAHDLLERILDTLLGRDRKEEI